MHFYCIKYWRSEVWLRPHATMQRWKARYHRELNQERMMGRTVTPEPCTVIRGSFQQPVYTFMTHRWICPFLWRYSSPSRTSFKMVAMLASSNTPVLCSPREMICLMMSKTEPVTQAEACQQMHQQYMAGNIRFGKKLTGCSVWTNLWFALKTKIIVVSSLLTQQNADRKTTHLDWNGILLVSINVMKTL